MTGQSLEFFGVDLPQFVIDTVGLSLLLFAAIWLLIGLLRTLGRHSIHERAVGLALLLAGLASIATFVYLSASTATRQAYIEVSVRELAIHLGENVLAVLIALLCVGVVYALAARWRNGSEIRFGVLATTGILVCLATTSYGLYATTFQKSLYDQSVAPVAANEIAIADHIPITIFENRVVQNPTALTLGPHNELYVAGFRGYIWVMQDTDQDGVADRVTEFAHGLEQPEGLAWSPDGLYVAVSDKLLLLKDIDKDGKADQTQVIVDGLPGEQFAFHQASGLTFGSDGRLYLGVGSTSDHDPETHPLAARILSVKPDGSDVRVYATGVRNPFGLIPAPDGGFFAIDNSSSGCIGENPDCPVTVDVPDEVNFITEGNDYGFPNYFGIPPQDSGTMPPIITLPDHSAPTGIVLYTGDQLPAKYKDRLLVALWTRSEIDSIRMFKIDDTHYTGDKRLFASGIPGPSAMVNSPSGGLYVASFSGNAIYEIGSAFHELKTRPLS